MQLGKSIKKQSKAQRLQNGIDALKWNQLDKAAIDFVFELDPYNRFAQECLNKYNRTFN